MLTPVILLISVLLSLAGELQALLDRGARMIGGGFTSLGIKKLSLQDMFVRVIVVPRLDCTVVRGYSVNDIQIIKDNVFDTI